MHSPNCTDDRRMATSMASRGNMYALRRLRTTERRRKIGTIAHVAPISDSRKSNNGRDV